MMRLVVNGKPFDGQPTSKLDTLLKVVVGHQNPEGTAVAVNEEVIPRSRWPDTVLKEGDHIEILGAVSGG